LAEDESLKKALQMGAEDYFVKAQHPINEIVEKVKNRLLEKSR
jgi:PleD family two-component response regulator